MALVFSVIRIFRITEIAGATRKDENILLAKRKRYNSTLNLTLMTVIIYTGNKVKSNRGEEKIVKMTSKINSKGPKTAFLPIKLQ